MAKKTKAAGRKEGLILKNLPLHKEKMIKEILSLSETPLSRIMVPKVSMVNISADKKIKDLLALFHECGYSRIPVYSGAVDNIVGIVHLKDIFRILSMHRELEIQNMPVVEFVRLPHFFYENINGLDVFLTLQRQKISTGIVIDEFGSVVGMVTVEDLLEEIVGEIIDEFDRERGAKIVAMSDGRYVVDPGVEIDKFLEILEVESPYKNVSTLAGLIYRIADRIPKVGEKIRFGEWEFTVLEGTSRKITKVSVEKK